MAPAPGAFLDHLPEHGIGVDVGGSGVRATALRLGSSGALGALVTEERQHTGDLAGDLLAVIGGVLPALDGTGDGVPIGIAAPGRKTADGRGLEQARHLEAAPGLLDELERAAPGGLLLPRRLASDAEAALVGEVVVEEGLLGGERSALLLSPGTGLAEAWLWCGELRPVEGPRAWELPPVRAARGARDLEHEASLSGLLRRWSGPTPIEWAAAEGDPRAIRAFERFAAAIARLVEVRGPRLEELARAAGAAPSVLVRSRRGTLFCQPAVRALVLPVLSEVAARHGARLVLPEAPASPHAACAGSLALHAHGAGEAP
jgi:predicted NBD/HSP70 family sugar kinase